MQYTEANDVAGGSGET